MGGSSDWIKPGTCSACDDDVKIPDTPCSWAGKCWNSEGQCQQCNASPFKNDDRCVCGPGAKDWIKPGGCNACNDDVEIPDTPCSWAGKCWNSEGKCQQCNVSPFPNDDRCVCGPGAKDWIKPGTCNACNDDVKPKGDAIIV